MVLASEHVDGVKNTKSSDERVKPINGNGHALSLKDLSVQLPMKFALFDTQYKLDTHFQPIPQHALTWRLLTLSK